LRQASRLGLKQSAPANCLLRSSATARAAGISSQKISRRGYVSESKKDSAQVSVDTTIRANQKAFFAETGRFPENQIIPGTNANTDAMMSPIAGILPYVRWWRISR
jgi:cysteine desulfurase